MGLHPIFASIVDAWQSAPRSRQLPQDTGSRPKQNEQLGSGTVLAMPKAMNLRAKLIEYHGNNRATFECPEGHRFKSTVMPKAPNGKVASEPMCAFMARRWQNTGVRIDCPACKRARS